MDDPINLGKLRWVDRNNIGIRSDDLLAEFTKLNASDHDSSEDDYELVGLSLVFLNYHCLRSKSEQESESSLSASEIIHGICGGLLCHSTATLDNSFTDCGDLVYPAFYF